MLPDIIVSYDTRPVCSIIIFVSRIHVRIEGMPEDSDVSLKIDVNTDESVNVDVSHGKTNMLRLDLIDESKR